MPVTGPSSLGALAQADVATDLPNIVDLGPDQEEILLGALLNNTDEIEGFLEDIIALLGGQVEPPEPEEDGAAAHVAGEGTDTEINLDQQNILDDIDDVHFPEVINDGILSQTINVAGGIAKSDDGIDEALGNAVVGDDYSADGSSSASADGTAFADMLEQDLDVGTNAQFNEADVSIVGSNLNSFSVGDDENGTHTNGIAPLPSGGDGTADQDGGLGAFSSSPGSADSFFDIYQSNDLYDQDDIDHPLVINNSSATQTVTVNGGADVDSDDGHVVGPAGASLQTGDNASVSGSTSASADATAVAELATQQINTGANLQSNAFSAEIVGINDNSNVVGEDDGADADDIQPDVSLFPDLIPDPSQGDDDPDADEDGTDQTFEITQINDLMDQDVIHHPQVNNNEGDTLTQNVSAFGGNAASDDGIDSTGGGVYDTFGTGVGDDFSITGAASATADAVAVADLLTQNISMGANIQANSVNIDIVGGSSTVEMIGEDDTA